MRNIVVAIGGLLLAAGLVFTFQGLGYLEGSPMTDEEFWAVVGPILAGFGVALMIVGARGPR